MKMKIPLFTLLLSLFLVSCDEDLITIPNGWECTQRRTDLKCRKEQLFRLECNHDKQAQFIIDCAKAANPMSDEEGEDLVAECGKQATKIYCTTLYFGGDYKISQDI